MAEELLFQSRGCRGQPRFLLRATGQMRNEAPSILGFEGKKQAQAQGLDQSGCAGPVAQESKRSETTPCAKPLPNASGEPLGKVPRSPSPECLPRALEGLP